MNGAPRIAPLPISRLALSRKARRATSGMSVSGSVVPTAAVHAPHRPLREREADAEPFHPVREQLGPGDDEEKPRVAARTRSISLRFRCSLCVFALNVHPRPRGGPEVQTRAMQVGQRLHCRAAAAQNGACTADAVPEQTADHRAQEGPEPRAVAISPMVLPQQPSGARLRDEGEPGGKPEHEAQRDADAGRGQLPERMAERHGPQPPGQSTTSAALDHDAWASGR